MIELKTMKNLMDEEFYHLSGNSIAGLHRVRHEAVKILKAIEESENGIIEVDGYIFSKEYGTILKWFLNITDNDIKSEEA